MSVAKSGSALSLDAASSGISKPKMREEEVTTLQRIVSACVGSLITSFVVTPLDVIKVRLQAQAPVSYEASEASSAVRIGSPLRSISPTNFKECTHYQFSNGLMDHMCSKDGCRLFETPPLGHTPATDAHQPLRFRGTIDAMVKLIRYEGVASLWTGLPPTLLMAVPATVFYFTSYDEFKYILEGQFGMNPNNSVSPMIAGATARVVAATLVSPLELIRTQMQSERTRQTSMSTVTPNERGIVSRLKQVVRSKGFIGLVRGLTPTLLRDVPFSALYWLGYERIKFTLTKRYIADPSAPVPLINKFWLSFVSGAGSGLIAAALTTPFDVIKTKMQVNMYSRAEIYPKTTIGIFNRIVLDEGWKGLTTGMTARLARVAPSCAIMISVYELGKAYFHRKSAVR